MSDKYDENARVRRSGFRHLQPPDQNAQEEIPNRAPLNWREELHRAWKALELEQQDFAREKEQFSVDFETRSVRLHEREIKLGAREKLMSQRFAKQQEELDALRTEQLEALDEERKRLRKDYESIQHANEQIVKERESLERDKLHQAKEYQELLEKNAAEYIEQTLDKLDSRLKEKSILAYVWQACGAISLIAGFAYFSYLTNKFDPLKHALDWTSIGYLSFRGALLVGLILGLARYASSTSKLLRTEAVKIEDRMHTINYGAFYLKTYGANADWDQVKEALQHWNTSDPNTLEVKPKEKHDRTQTEPSRDRPATTV